MATTVMTKLAATAAATTPVNHAIARSRRSTISS